MPIYKTAYDTTAGSGFVLTGIKSTLSGYIQSGVDYENFNVIYNEKISLTAIAGAQAADTHIKIFAHPMLLEDPVKHRSEIFVDIRNVVGFDKSERKIIVRNKTEYDLIKIRAILQYVWLTSNPSTLSGLSHVPASIYSSMLSEAISRKFNLNPLEQAKVAIIASVFYNNLFNSSTEITDEKRQEWYALAVKTTKAPYNMINPVVDAITKLDSVADFCATVKSVIDNPSLQDLNSGLVITLVASIWFGSNSREVVAVSLEHPPTWIALCYSALNDKTYSRSQLGKLAERWSRGKGGDVFLRALVSLLEGYTESNKSITASDVPASW